MKMELDIIETLEKKIWEAACIMRGSMEPSDYKVVVLGLIFLKYCNEVERHRASESMKNAGSMKNVGSMESAGSMKNAGSMANTDSRIRADSGSGSSTGAWACTHAGTSIVLPDEARWERIERAAQKGEAGRALDQAMAALERQNPSLTGTLYQQYNRTEIDQKKLGKAVMAFSQISFGIGLEGGSEDGLKDGLEGGSEGGLEGDLEEADGIDLLGKTYEYCLDKFSEQGGKYSGEFYTPTCVARLMTNLLMPSCGKVYDPCCGSGNLLIHAARSVKNGEYYGQDSSFGAWKIAKMNLAVRGIQGSLGERAADTFSEDLHPGMEADYIFANPPFNQGAWGRDGLADDGRWVYGLPPENNANFAWLQHILHHLKDGGRAVVVLANGALSSTFLGEGEIRKRMIEDGVIEAIISLPAQMFYTTQMPVSLWILAKGRDKASRENIFFCDAEKLGKKVSRKLCILEEKDMERICNGYHRFAAGEEIDGEGLYGAVPKGVIEDNGYLLNPNRYIQREPEVCRESFEAEMESLMEELSGLFDEVEKLQHRIRQNFDDKSKFI